MTALLKAGDQAPLARVSRYAHSAGHLPPLPAPATQETEGPADNTAKHGAPAASGAKADSTLAQHQAELEALRDELRNAAVSGEKREEEAFKRGKLEGQRESADHADAALTRLSAALEHAEAEFSNRFDRFEALSLQIAQTALAKVFGNRSRFADMVSEAVRHQLAGLDNNLATAVLVSSADFPDDQALTALGAQIRKVCVAIGPALSSGECMIDLRMGQLDASIGKQWSALSAILEGLATEATAQ